MREKSINKKVPVASPPSFWQTHNKYFFLYIEPHVRSNIHQRIEKTKKSSLPQLCPSLLAWPVTKQRDVKVALTRKLLLLLSTSCSGSQSNHDPPTSHPALLLTSWESDRGTASEVKKHRQEIWNLALAEPQRRRWAGLILTICSAATKGSKKGVAFICEVLPHLYSHGILISFFSKQGGNEHHQQHGIVDGKSQPNNKLKTNVSVYLESTTKDGC